MSLRSRLPIPTLLVGLGIAVVGIAYFLWLGEVAWPVDDAYITERNARFLFAGQDPAWPEATPLHGTTSIVHVGAIGILALVVAVPIAQAAVGITAAALYAMGLTELAKIYALGRIRTTAFVALGFLTAGVTHQLSNGLETGLGLAIVTWMLVTLRWSDTKVHRLFPALCGLAPFVRPELVMLSVLLGASFAVDRFRNARARLAPDMAQVALWSVAPSLPLVAILLLVTDSPIPLTIEAKRAFFAEDCWDSALKLAAWTKAMGGALRLLGPVVAGVCLLPFARHGWVLLTFALAFVGAYLWQFPGALAHYQHRYLFVLLPVMLAGIGGAGKWPGIVVGGAALVFAVVSLPASLGQQRASLQHAQTELRGVAGWLHMHAAPGSTILVHDAGYIASVPGLTFVDLVGLKTPSSVAVHQDLTWPTCGRDRFVADDVLARRAHPVYFVVLEGWDKAYRFNAGLRFRGWGVTRADEDRPGSAYGVFELTAP